MIALWTYGSLKKFYNEMPDWKNTSSVSSTMMIHETRRIGKSTIAETFAKMNMKTI